MVRRINDFRFGLKGCSPDPGESVRISIVVMNQERSRIGPFGKRAQQRLPKLVEPPASAVEVLQQKP